METSFTFLTPYRLLEVELIAARCLSATIMVSLFAVASVVTQQHLVVASTDCDDGPVSHLFSNYSPANFMQEVFFFYSGRQRDITHCQSFQKD